MRVKFKIPRLILMSVFLIIFSIAHGQNDIKKIELNIQRTIRQLIGKVDNKGNDSQLMRNSLSDLSKTTNLLFKTINSDNNINLESDSLFISSLVNSQKTLDELVVHWESNSHAKSIIDAIQNDYSIKISASALGANSKILTEVQVTVFTKKGEIEIDGYDVKCNYLWDYRINIAKFVFNNQTNNAIRNLSPGYYVMWIEKNGTVIQKKDKVEIGNLQSQKESIIFNL